MSFQYQIKGVKLIKSKNPFKFNFKLILRKDLKINYTESFPWI
jgi:hypothetical protein